MSPDEQLELYERLEGWAVYVAERVAYKAGLARWRDDLEQEARLGLWQAVTGYDPAKHDGVEKVCRWKVQCALKDALRRYGRWESHEQTGLHDLFKDE